ncbi:MAG TPA: hypothetical protein VMZ71_05410 [Gemmataceae bacterium]|nr:hypothetical protein [Gemmataceae bacterium]
MTRRMLAVAALLLSPLAAFGDPPPVPKSPAFKLVEQLGSEDYAEREAASKQLDELGAAAFDAIRAGCQSNDPEVASRARELASRIGRRIENEKFLAPSVVELAADETPLDTVLADLSKQTGYAVVVGGLKADELAAKKVTLKTGKVAFWDAVKALNDAAGLQIASVGGFTAPGSVPYSYRSPTGALSVNRAQQLGADRPPLPAGPGPIAGPLEVAKQRAAARTAPLPNMSVVLEARDAGKKRSWAVYGAVCVEAFTLPTVPNASDAAWALLQVWPEPKLVWKETRGVSVSRAADELSQLLAVSPPPPAPLPVQMGLIGGKRGGFVPPNGVLVFNEGGFDATTQFPSFQTNLRQHVVKFKTAEKPSAVLKEFAGSIVGVIRSPTERVAAAELEAGKQVAATTAAHGVSLKATLIQGETGDARLDVDLTYPQQLVQPVTTTDRLTGTSGTTNFSNQTLYGVRVTDAAGNPYPLTATSITQRPDFTGQQMAYGFKFTLRRRPGDDLGEAKSVAFWGTYGKTVVVPFDLRDAPLVAGKK